MNQDNISLTHVQQNNQTFDFKYNFKDSVYENNIHNCQYYDENEINKKFNNISTEQFSILSLNIQSLPGKFNEFQTFLASTLGKFKPSVIAIQEIWNKPTNCSFDLSDYHPLHFTIRDKQGLKSNAGGGVGLWVEKSLCFEPINSISIFLPRVFESQFIKIKNGKNKYTVVGNIYRPNTAPYADVKYFNQTIREIFSKIRSDPCLRNAQDVILVGDMNINLLKHTLHSDTETYLDTLLENNYLPLITLPTRIGHNTATLLDHICTNIADDNFDSGIIVSDISDHFPVFYIRHFKDKFIEKKSQQKTRKFDSKSKSKFKKLLEDKNWDNVLLNGDQESAFNNFFESIDNCFESSFPEKNVNSSRKNRPFNPWMSEALIISRKRKAKLFNKKLRKPCQETKSRFKEFNAVYTRLVRAARKKYFDDKFQEYSKDCKKTWQTINSVLGRGRKTVNIPDVFVSNGRVLSGAVEISEGFNNFFANIGPDLAKTIKGTEKRFSDFLSHETDENFVFANMTPDIINDALNRLKSKNSSGPDKISTNLLKSIIPTIMGPICYLFNLSFKTGFIPTILKTAKIVPIFKAGETDNFTNYRPISLLSSFSKLLEKVAANQIMKYLNKFKLLYEHQYGFRAKHNTTQPLIHFLDKIYNALNKPVSEYTLGIFIDLTKAFDTCDVEILLSKLEHYGFRGTSNLWFKNYLNGRKQFTSIRGADSSLKEISCGVPQGSILGPILFLILINDLPKASKFFTILFADDTTLQLSSKSLQDLYDLANFELSKIEDWFKANKLTLNASKTKYILFKKKKEDVNITSLKLLIDNKDIERVGTGCKNESFKFVGVHLDENLNWNHHLKLVKNKASSAVFALSSVKNILPSNIKLTIYNSLFRSYIEYGISAWGRNKCSEMKQIHILQKRAVRLIDNSKAMSHSDPLFLKYKILKVNDLVDYNQAIFMYKYTNKLLPYSFENIFKKLGNFERSLNYQLDILNLSLLKYLPSSSLLKIWNNLPLDLKRSNSLSIFKNRLLNSLFENYMTMCYKPNCNSCKTT